MTGNTLRGICAADLDNDRDVDLVITEYTADPSPEGFLSIFPNEGNGSFATPTHYPADEHAWKPFASDLDNDFDNDLLVSNVGSAYSFSYFENIGEYSFNASLDIGNDSITEWAHESEFGFSVTTPSLVTAINEYITSHSDEDDGIVDNNITVPIVFHADKPGEIEIEYVSVLVGTFETDPTTMDTDKDGLNDGEEFNIALARPQFIDTLTYNGVEYDEIHLPTTSDLITGDEIRLTNDPDTSTQPHVLACGNKIHIVWIDDRNGFNQIFYRVSSDFGDTWDEVTLTTSAYDPQYLVATCDGDNIGIAWENGLYPPMSQTFVIFSPNSGETWTDPFDVSDAIDASGTFFPSIDVDGNEVYLLFHAEHWNGVDFIGSSRLFWSEDNVTVLNLEGFYVLTNGGTSVGLTSNVKAEGENIHVIMLDDLNSDIEYWRSMNGGDTFDGPMKIGDFGPDTIQNNEYREYFDLDVKGDFLQLVYCENIEGTYQVSLLTSLNNGVPSTWTSRHLTASNGNSMYPEVFIEQSGTSTIVYQDDSDGTDRIFRQRIDELGNQDSPEACMTPGTTGATTPSICVDHANHAYLVWEDARDGNPEIYMKKGSYGEIVYANIPMTEGALEYVKGASMRLDLPTIRDKEFSANFNDCPENFTREVDRAYSNVSWDAVNGRVSFHSDRRDSGDELLTRSLGMNIMENSPDWELSATTTITDRTVLSKAYPLFISDSSRTKVDGPNCIQFYWHHGNPEGTPKIYDSLGARYYDASGNPRIDFKVEYLYQAECHLKMAYSSGTLAMYIMDESDNVLGSGSYTIGSNAGDGFTLGKIGVSSYGDSHGQELWAKGWTDDICFSFSDNIRFSVDAGNDGDLQFTSNGEISTTSLDLASEINQYLSIYEDGDDGVIDGNVSVPIVIHSEIPGDIRISNVSILVDILITNPARSDTDGDGLGDGQELNIAGHKGKTINAVYFEGNETLNTTLEFYRNKQNVPYLQIPASHGALEYVTKATMDLEWTPESILINDFGPSSPEHLAVATGPFGSVHVVWADNTDYGDSGPDSDIFYKKWNGTWTETEIISSESTGQSDWPAIAVNNENGHVHIAWADETNYNGSGTDFDIFYKRWNGSVWGITKVISNESIGHVYCPSMAIDSIGNVHIVWLDSTVYTEPGPCIDEYEAVYKKINETTWSDIEVVSSSADGIDACSPSIAIDSRDRVHVVWATYCQLASGGHGYDVFYRNKTETAWSSMVQMNCGQMTDSGITFAYQHVVDVAINSTDGVHIVWRETHYIRYKYSSGTGWIGPENLFHGEYSGDSYNPQIAIDSAENIHIIWKQEEDKILYRIRGKQFLSKIHEIKPEADIPAHLTVWYTMPAIVADPFGEEIVHIVWATARQQNSQNQHDIWYKAFKHPLTPTLDIGYDGDVQWKHEIGLTGTETTIDFSNELNEYLNAHKEIETGYISVPLGFHAGEYGHLNISNIIVTFDVIVTDPTSEYTDDDALSDGEEIYGWTATRDINGDGDTDDLNEEYIIISNPTLADSDFDGAPDDVEKNNGTDPTNIDTDFDGLSDFEEMNWGSDNFITNASDADTDGDFYNDPLDVFPTNPTGAMDTDMDEMPDDRLEAPWWTGLILTEDLDDDNDGALDTADAFPLNPTGSVDTDGDGKPNVQLEAPWWFGGEILVEDLDDDNDGFIDSTDAFPLNPTGAVDTDSDGLPNEQLPVPSWFTGVILQEDLDDDGDGWSDTIEIAAGTDPLDYSKNPGVDDDGDGVPQYGGDGVPGALGDDDCDGYPDFDDPENNEWGWPGSDDDKFIGNGDEWYDHDMDDIGDNADLEDDGDGTDDGDDAFPWNPTGDVDTDGDGLPDKKLDKPWWFNGLILTEDLDDDDDGVPDTEDDFPLDPKEWFDTDGDGIGDNADLNDDNDRYPDVNDAFPLDENEWLDTDGDGIGNNADPDDDGDGLDDKDEPKHRTNPLNPDTDGDGLTDGEEVKGWIVIIEINNDLGYQKGVDFKYWVYSDPLREFSDNDPLPDYWEKQYGTNPWNEDSDGDGINDGDELVDAFGGGWIAGSDWDKDGMKNGPTDFDSNGDSYSDGECKIVTRGTRAGTSGYKLLDHPEDWGEDFDNDGLPNKFEYDSNYNPDKSPGAPIYRTHYLNPDSDGDGVWDGPNRTFNPVRETIVQIRTPSGSSVTARRVTTTFSRTVYVKVAKHCSPDTYIGEDYDPGDKDPAGNLYFIDKSKRETNPALPDMDHDGLLDGQEVLGHKSFRGFWNGNILYQFKYKTSPYDDDTDDDGVDDFWDPIPLDYDMDGDGFINHLSLIDPGNRYYHDRIFDVIQEYSANLKRDGATGEFIQDQNIDGDGDFNEVDDDDDNDGMTDEYEEDKGFNSLSYPACGWQHRYIHNEKYALLAGYDLPAMGPQKGEFCEPSWHAVNRMRKVLTYHGYKDDDTLGFNPSTDHIAFIYEYYESGETPATHPDKFPDFEGERTENTILKFDMYIESIASIITQNDFFTFMYAGHGQLKFDYKSYGWLPLSEKLSSVNMVYNRSLFLIENCASGYAIHSNSGQDIKAVPVLSDTNRIIITSSDHSQPSYWRERPYSDEWFFSTPFLEVLGQKTHDFNIWDCFEGARLTTHQWDEIIFEEQQNPQLDADGDGLSQENDYDFSYDGVNYPFSGDAYEWYSFYWDYGDPGDPDDDIKVPYGYDYNVAGPDGVTDREIAENTYI